MSEKKQYLLVVNPNAGRGKAKALLSQIKQRFIQAQADITVYLTQTSGDARAHVEREGRRFDVIVAVGGDGTINEVVTGMINLAKPLGIIPIGSGNDFARSCGIPLDSLTTAIDIILRHQTTRIDVGVFNDRYFVNALGIGFDGYVNHRSHRIRLVKGGLKYLVALAMSFLSYRPVTINFKSEQHSFERKVFSLSIGNGRFVGNGMVLTPKAVLNDQWLDIFFIGQVARWRLVKNFSKILKGKKTGLSEVSRFRVHAVDISSDQPIPLHYDGESLADNPLRVTISLLPEHLEVICRWS